MENFENSYFDREAPSFAFVKNVFLTEAGKGDGGRYYGPYFQLFRETEAVGRIGKSIELSSDIVQVNT